MTHDLPQSDNFKPSLWVPGGHAQTLWRKLAPVKQVIHRRERVELKDKDFIDLDWHELPDTSNSHTGTIVLILHGLCGCSRSTYIQSLQNRLAANGYNSVAMNFRGCSGEINRLAKAYHSGITEDLAEVIDWISAKYNFNELIVTGYSLGANVLLKWLGETGANCKVDKAIAVSTPFSLKKCSSAMLKGFTSIYGKYFLRRLVNEMELKKSHFRQTENLLELERLDSIGDLRSIKSLWQFDDLVTAPLHGFDSAEDYYEKCSSAQYLSAIETPTLLIQSQDDPIIPPHALPLKDELGDSVKIDLSSSGGHVGFASASDRFWLEHRMIQFLST